MCSSKGVGIVTYNRSKYLGEVIKSVVDTVTDAKIVVADDGSTDETSYIVSQFKDIFYVRGPNKGVAHNKNRALFTLQNCSYIAIIEDDLVAIEPGWFELYQKAAHYSGIHHFCRVQDKEVPETIPEFSADMINQKLTPIYGESPRGDLTFITKAVINKIGGLNPQFIGVGYAHGEWSNRAFNAGLIPHPRKWIDIKEARDKFIQKGDTEGGRWNIDKKVIKEQIKRNRAIQRDLKASKYIYCELDLT